LTIGRNKPILDKYLPLKRLLLEAYEQGKLIAAIPFVSKILQTCVTSKVFKPPNPWLVGLLKLLVEFYNMSNLKQQLAYEVEILFQKITVDISCTCTLWPC
jgi:CCR4-NOT transcription complex subunit 1